MQFWAILRDSYREAVSTWTLHVMLAMSAVLMLFVASIGYRMVTLKDDLENKFALMNWALRQNPTNGSPQLFVENVDASKPNEPWASDYKFDIVVRCATAEDLKKAESSGAPIRMSEVRSLVRQELFYLDKIEVETVPGGIDSERRFRFTTRGTKTPDALAWPHEPSVFFSLSASTFTMSLRECLYFVESKLVNNLGAWIALLVSVVVTAGFIPGMLGKGALDLYISKPITRTRLLIFKYVGGLTFVFILLGVTVTGVWAILGIRSGVWSPQFLLSIPLLTFYFAILYAVSTLVGVLTRSSLLAILATVMAWAAFWGFGKLHAEVAELDHKKAQVREQLEKVSKGGDPDDLPPQLNEANEVLEWLRFVDRFVYPVVPRTYDLDSRSVQFIADGLLTDAEKKRRELDRPLPPWWQTAGISLGFIGVCLALSCWRMNTRDG